MHWTKRMRGLKDTSVGDIAIGTSLDHFRVHGNGRAMFRLGIGIQYEVASDFAPYASFVAKRFTPFSQIYC